MWSWSRHHADRAAAASFTAWRIRDPEPTVIDPEFSETSQDNGATGGPRNGERRTTGSDEAMGAAVAPADADVTGGEREDVSERELAALFAALADMAGAVSVAR
ncbi:hypothetical protein [Nocardia aurantiaca]|uniref:Uncharacterized protein n=1 Tax=Nocardia aurantiaca TaxID=2675850 RepID=A0A6I3KRL8_9NOCA|nr:hypothetical protein [Nocardia aurantiaca]MTE11756.1 hypothetical protein [Nocardia aurantiaca]